MQSIVTALDEPWRERVEEVWGEIKAIFGLKQIAGATQPHFTYHVAERYDAAAIERVLSSIAAATPAFSIETHGVGIARGPQTLLYLHVTRSDELLAVHRRIARDIAPLAEGAKRAYDEATWVPHITLAAGAVPESQIPEISSFLATRDYGWTIPITNICFVPDTSSASAPWLRFDLARP